MPSRLRGTHIVPVKQARPRGKQRPLADGARRLERRKLLRSTGLAKVGAIILIQFNLKEVREINIFALVLLVQSVPFVAAAALGAIEHSRLNDFIYWRNLEAKVIELVPILHRPAIAEAPVTPNIAQPPVNQNEPVP